MQGHNLSTKFMFLLLSGFLPQGSPHTSVPASARPQYRCTVHVSPMQLQEHSSPFPTKVSLFPSWVPRVRGIYTRPLFETCGPCTGSPKIKFHFSPSWFVTCLTPAITSQPISHLPAPSPPSRAHPCTFESRTVFDARR